MAPFQKLKLVEHSKVSPPPGSVPSTSLPLTFFDLPWLLFPPNQPLFFFHFPHQTSHFISKILPNLKRSLSLTLQHFFPLAGNLLAPPPPAEPALLYTDGDSVSLTVSESSADYHHLSGDHPRLAADFHPLVPPLVADRTDPSLLPILAVKVTVFPGSGVSVGFSYRNVAADSRTFDRFLKFWMSVSKSGCVLNELIPTHDRCSMKAPNGLREIFLQQWWQLKHFPERPFDTANRRDTVRATFVVGRPEMEKIKRLVLSRKPYSFSSSSLFLSPYVLTCALLWVCLIKARAVKLSGNEPLCFGFIAGGIHRLDYPVPTSYLGNCVAFGRSVISGDELTGENGLFFAARSIGEKVKELNGNVLGGAEEWVSVWSVMVGSDHDVVVSGSPKVSLYGLDFGWGRAEKIEDVSIDASGAVWLAESRSLEGGIEIGLSVPRPTMDIFTCLFTQALQDSDPSS